MQSEVSIAKQLSGGECLRACLKELETVLSMDDRFKDHMAYAGFRAVIDFKFYPHQSYIPDVERLVVMSEGDLSTPPETGVSATVEIPVRPPNQVREEADMPQPVLVTDQTGQSHEEWKTVKKAPPKMKVPVNKIMGV